jgi:hypothetical protein
MDSIHEPLDSRIGFKNNRYWKPEYSSIPGGYWLQVDWNIAKGMKEGFLLWYEAHKKTEIME